MRRYAFSFHAFPFSALSGVVCVLALVVAMLGAGCAQAQSTAVPVVESSADTVFHLDEHRTPRRFESLAEWLGRADSLRTHIRVSAGLSPLPERTPLSPEWSEPVVMDGYTVQHVRLETLPGFYLFGTVYRPEGASVAGAGADRSSTDDGPATADANPTTADERETTGDETSYPAVLSPHGHWEHGRFEHRLLGSIPARGAHFARMGFIVLTYSMIGYNEGEDQLPHRFYDERHALWGFGAMGLQLWNSLRALDFLSTLDGVDPERIGMTGASGGGTQTFLLTAVDDRIKVAAPVNMISLRMQGGCVCENAPLLRLDADNVEIGGLAAPRPLLMVSTSGDWTTATPEEEYPAMRSIYGLFGAAGRVHNVHLDYPHNYNADSRAAVYDWFARWLLDPAALEADTPPPDVPISSEPVLDDVEVVPSSLGLPPSSRSLDQLFSEWRERSVDVVISSKPSDWAGIEAYREAFGDAYRHVFDTGRSVSTRSVEEYLAPRRTGAGHVVAIVAAAENRREAVAAARDSMAAGTSAFVVIPQERAYDVPTNITHWATYNATTTTRRVDAIRRSMEGIRSRPDVTGMDIVGLGEAGLWTLLARALVDDVDRTVVDLGDLEDPLLDGFDSGTDDVFVDRLFVPGIRRAGDVRTAAVLTVPARLELHGLSEGALRNWFEDVYRAAAASDMLRIE